MRRDRAAIGCWGEGAGPRCRDCGRRRGPAAETSWEGGTAGGERGVTRW